ncbi:MAG: LytR family transcriptional regulator [Microbacteriaceae bacterium]|nr:LytR family transcriptional regulator [Microbacteriaceae bacterium]
MTKRAWWLVALNLLIPGSVQMLAGNRRLGRFGLAATLALWVIAIIGLVTWLVAHSVIYAVVTNGLGLTVVQVVLAAYAVLWVVLTIDTLRLARLVRASPSARPAIAMLAIVTLFASAGVAGYGALTAGVARSTVGKIFGGTDVAAPVDHRYNILLLGGDAGPDRVGLRPDSTSVLSVDAATGAATIIGIPRNMEQIQFAPGSPLWTAFPQGYNCGDQCLIDYLYTYADEHRSLYPDAAKSGSSAAIEAMKDAAEGVTGLKIQYFGLIDMQGFADLINALGGVTIDVPQRTPWGGITAARPQGYFEVGSQKMTGEQALWYARSRYDGNDYQRMARQRQVQEAMLTQFQPSVVLTKFQAIATAGAQVVKTDIPSGALPGFVDLADRSRKLPVTRLELVPPMFNPAQPDYNKIHAAVDAAIAKATPAR